MTSSTWTGLRSIVAASLQPAFDIDSYQGAGCLPELMLFDWRERCQEMNNVDKKQVGDSRSTCVGRHFGGTGGK
jgi:hypothetical protein